LITDFFTQSIVIQLGTPTQTSTGGQTISWSTQATVNGYIDLMSGSQQQRANKVLSEATHIMLCKSGLTLDREKMYRVSFGGDYYRILYCDDVFSHHSEIYLVRSGVDN
jgi:head-tail adaptor